MFNRKKKEIEWLQEQLVETIGRLVEKQKEMELADERERSLDAKAEELKKERDDLDIQLTKKANDYAGLLEEFQKHVQGQKKDLEDLKQIVASANETATKIEAENFRLKGENRAMRDKLEAAQRETECPSDCKNRTNHNACRTCTRYPHAKDKYELAK